MMKTKVVIAGGTGFVGQGIIQQLDPTQYDVHSLSRHIYHPHTNDKTTYHVVDLSDTPSVLAIIQDADWVIDAVGILFPNPIKKQNYQNSSYAPAKYLIDALLLAPRTKLLFISLGKWWAIFHGALSQSQKIRRNADARPFTRTRVYGLSRDYF